ncbi:acyl-CoA thioesterase [Nakamurella sp. YIM 132087]|uniref:Acyl-CoA thioesterase n=1 Tax=Nakamurella alba TaxID=2665158 RepID=A0A7K1FH88_9ACTN|nr:acyl-CoA thioesterase [Nakamurella alba]
MRYSTTVRVRWSDLDAFGHVNNARTATLLEEARVDWLFTEASKQGANRLTDGIVVSRLEIRYLRPITFGETVTVSMGVTELRAVSTTIDYLVHADDVLAVTASTQLVPMDLEGMRPRRWDENERGFLAGYLGT